MSAGWRQFPFYVYRLHHTSQKFRRISRRSRASRQMASSAAQSSSGIGSGVANRVTALPGMVVVENDTYYGQSSKISPARRGLGASSVSRDVRGHVSDLIEAARGSVGALMIRSAGASASVGCFARQAERWTPISRIGCYAPSRGPLNGVCWKQLRITGAS